MPVEFNKNDGSKKLEFIRNTAYNGTDYGPDYPDKATIVDNQWARIFLTQGRAKEVEETKGKNNAKS